ncbi:MAG: hypothetical protein J1F11_12615 [Oscillospiraceae bacterium]|nr:hypothetical protein [Oscillospiraceae bacterium]
MNLHTFQCLAYGFMGAVFGTVFLMQYLQFQQLIGKISKMGEETFGQIISMDFVKGTGRYQSDHYVVSMFFEADGETIVPPSFHVSPHSQLYVGQLVFVQYFRYNPEECLIKETPHSHGYLNRWSAFGGTMGLICAAAFYLLALFALIAMFL